MTASASQRRSIADHQRTQSTLDHNHNTDPIHPSFNHPRTQITGSRGKAQGRAASRVVGRSVHRRREEGPSSWCARTRRSAFGASASRVRVCVVLRCVLRCVLCVLKRPPGTHGPVASLSIDLAASFACLTSPPTPPHPPQPTQATRARTQPCSRTSCRRPTAPRPSKGSTRTCYGAWACLNPGSLGARVRARKWMGGRRRAGILLRACPGTRAHKSIAPRWSKP